MENYQMNRPCGRPYNATCGMAKEMMSGQQCSCRNNSEISHPALHHVRVTFRMPKPEMRKCIHTSIRWKQPWRMFPARNLLRHMILDMR